MILQTAIEHYGVEKQLNKVQEELGELITAISKWRNDKHTINGLIDEIADVEIMVNQLGLILNKEYGSQMTIFIEKRTDFKLDRLKQRIEDDINKQS